MKKFSFLVVALFLFISVFSQNFNYDPMTDFRGLVTTIKRYPTIGSTILDNSTSKILQVAHIIALSHHERWDGQGYPNGLAGENIPLWGRICAVADVFDAVTSDRPYKTACSIEERGATASPTASASRWRSPAIGTGASCSRAAVD